MSSLNILKRSAYAWMWLVIWGIVTFIVLCLVIVDPSFGGTLGQWHTRQAALFWALVCLIGAAFAIHRFDEFFNGRGFRNLHRGNPATLTNLDDGAVSGMLTVQSIRAALTLGMLLALTRWLQQIVGFSIIRPLAWKSLYESPLAGMLAIVIAALATSTVTTLAALLCYDYSLRFDWKDKSKVKLALRQKAHRLGVIGFYCLMWSLAAATALLDAYICVAAITVVFLVMWYYYFFPKDVLVEPNVTTSAANNITPNSATLNGTVNPNGTSTKAHFEWGTTAKYGSVTPGASSSGSNLVSLTENIAGLTPKTTYHYRLVAGTVNGADTTFETS